MDWTREFHDKRGTRMLTAEDQRQWLEDAGFVDIQVIEKCTDCGTYTRGMAALKNY
jgi:hypothetical protein